MPVQKGDVLQIPAQEEWKKITVDWMQDRKHKEGDYYQVKFQNNRAGEVEASNVIYISDDKLDTFKAQAEKIDTGFSFTVNEDYLYVDQKGDKDRFLIYHDPARQVAAYRFVEEGNKDPSKPNVSYDWGDFLSGVGRTFVDVTKTVLAPGLSIGERLQ